MAWLYLYQLDFSIIISLIFGTGNISLMESFYTTSVAGRESSYYVPVDAYSSSFARSYMYTYM